MKVIETNMIYDIFGDIKDVQSRVVEIQSWEDYVKETKGDRVSLPKKDLVGNLNGYTATIPNKSTGKFYRESEYNLIYANRSEDGSVSLHTSYIVLDKEAQEHFKVEERV